MVENQTGKRIKKIRRDNGTEYVNSDFENYLKTKGIQHQVTVRYTPEQNGVAERTNRTIVETARCLMQEAQVDERMWAEAANTAVYLKNRSPHKSIKEVTPEEKWTGKKISLDHLRVFGCIAYAHIPNQLRKKFDSKSKPYIFVGYCELTKGYRLFDLEKPGQIIKSRDVIFFENQFSLNNEENLPVETEVETPVIIPEESLPVSSLINPDADQSCDEIGKVESETASYFDGQELPRRTQRQRKEKEFPEYELYYTSQTSHYLIEDPTSVEEAMNSPEKERWKEAMEEEYQSMLDNNAWTLVEKPSDKKIVQCKWVFQVKRNTNSEPRYKARLVAKGFTQ